RSNDDLEKQFATLSRFVALTLLEGENETRRAALALRSKALEAIALELQPRVASLNVRLESAYGALSKEAQERSRRVLLALVGIADPSDPSSGVAIRRALSEFDPADVTCIQELASHGVLDLTSTSSAENAPNSSSTGPSVRLAQGEAVREWERLKSWIKED